MSKRAMKKIKIEHKEFEIPLGEKQFLYEDVSFHVDNIWDIGRRKFGFAFISKVVLFVEFPDGVWRRVTDPLEYIAWLNLVDAVEDSMAIDREEKIRCYSEIVCKLFPDFDMVEV